MTTNTTSGAAIQRYKIGYHEDEWGQRSSTPSGIPDASGSWVRYADHVTALAAGQATAAQQGVAYAVLPEKYYLAGGEVPTWDAKQMYAFADATHTLRASHGQAPDGTTEPTEQYLNVASQCAATATSELAKNVLVDDGSGTLRELLNDAADAIRAGWGQPAPAETGNSVSAQTDSVQEDAARWHWMAEYLVGTRTDLDDEIVASETVNDLRKLVEAAIKQGASHDNS